jgi:hypothetical protein
LGKLKNKVDQPTQKVSGPLFLGSVEHIEYNGGMRVSQNKTAIQTKESCGARNGKALGYWTRKKQNLWPERKI